MAPFAMNVLCIRFHPESIQGDALLNDLNEKIIQRVNDSGEFYLSGTRLKEKFVIRVVIGQTNVEERHVVNLFATLMEAARQVN